jgi:hypothetical protein
MRLSVDLAGASSLRCVVPDVAIVLSYQTTNGAWTGPFDSVLSQARSGVLYDRPSLMAAS